jgi:selenophosphate synthetase-related protein
MLLECSQAGAVIDIDAIPRPASVPLQRWLGAFPSYGFLLSVSDEHLPAVLALFRARDIGCAAIGRVDGSRKLAIRQGGKTEAVWDLAREALIGCAPAAPEAAA